MKSALALGNLACEEVDYVIMSHVHWDHIGTPSDFKNATFLVGPGTGKLLKNEMGEELFNPFFERDLLPTARTIEFPAVGDVAKGKVFNEIHGWCWESVGSISHAVDVFNDGTVYIVNSPGHVPGHLNALIRISEKKWVYLGADACHHAKILNGQADFGSWENEKGRRVTIHHDIDAARETLAIMKQLRKHGLDGKDVEVVLAHDGDWARTNADHFFPNHL